MLNFTRWKTPSKQPRTTATHEHGTGGGDMNADVFWEWTSQGWRRHEVPPEQSDLWRMANKLQLYGEEQDEDDEGHQRVPLSSTAPSRGRGHPGGAARALGHASTEEEAQMIVYGGRSRSPQLYAMRSRGGRGPPSHRGDGRRHAAPAGGATAGPRTRPHRKSLMRPRQYPCGVQPSAAWMTSTSSRGSAP